MRRAKRQLHGREIPTKSGHSVSHVYIVEPETVLMPRGISVGSVLVLSGIGIDRMLEPASHAVSDTFTSPIDIAISRMDRDMMVAPSGNIEYDIKVSKTVSMIDLVDNKLFGVIRLGDPAPGNLSPPYKTLPLAQCVEAGS